MYRRKRGLRDGREPLDRGRNGSKHHLLVDATGIPLAWTVTGGNRNDVTQLVPLVERVPPVRGKVGRPRRRPDIVTADRDYGHDK
jgi:Transposase DDE domain